MTVFDDLLRVQEHDTRIDQLRHRRDTLPQRARLTEIAGQVAGFERDAGQAGSDRDELAREQKLHEDEVASLGDKRMSAQAKLYGGDVSNPRELQALQEEVEALGRRVGHLDDRTLELMEQIEPLDGRLAEVASSASAARAEAESVEAQLTAAEAEIDAEIDSERVAREQLIGDVAPELRAEYEQLRGQSGGVAIARLTGAQCGGCHLSLSAMEVARIRKLSPDEPVHCEECGRLLAR